MMDKKLIAQWAKQIGMPVSETFGPMVGACPVDDLLERFAALVAAHEREQCAAACLEKHANGNFKHDTREDCSAAIRARSTG